MNPKIKKVAGSLFFTIPINEFFFKASKNAEFEISIDTDIIRLTVTDIIKFGLYRKVFSNNNTMDIEQVTRLPEIPYPLKQNSISNFTLTAKTILPNPVYSIRIITASGKIFRSEPYYPEKLSGEKINMNVWSYSKQGIITLSIPREYSSDIQYTFTANAGNLLPTTPPYHILYGKPGGFDQWLKSFKDTTQSAPVWKIEKESSILEFDGKDNYLAFPPYIVPEQSFTLSFSIMPMSDSKQIIMQTNISPAGFQLLLEDSVLSGQILNKKGKCFNFKTISRLNKGAWSDVKIFYDLKKLSIKINEGNIETFDCDGILYNESCMIFAGAYPQNEIHRFKGFLRSFSFRNYTVSD
jgi:hypothetical protein